jgi:aryl-alcohol dehydrogenase-like predicted oxidoreductase
MPLDHYVTLGRSGLRVSPLCLGTMTFGPDLGWGASVEESHAVLDRYLERGGNFIDTANVYTLGHSETILGAHLAGKRDRVVLATKFYGNLFPGDPNGGGAGAKSVLGAVHESLRRLRTDYIDLLWMHAWDWHTPIEETMRTLDDLVRAGKVRYIGFSDTPAWKVAQAQTIATLRGWTPLIALQIEYSLLERTVEGELIPMARELGLGVTPWSPLKGGVLSGKYTRATAGTDKPARALAVGATLKNNERAYAIIDALAAIASELGTTPARVALAWVHARPGVTSTILGARNVEQLDANLGALGVTLTPAQTAQLDELSKPVLPFPVAFLSRASGFMHGGITINGESAVPSPFAPKPGDKTH